MRLRTFLAGLCVATLMGCRPATTIYIVRHAERANDSDTTSLSAAGLQRADNLARRLAGVRLDSIYVTPYTRTRQTAQPTARAKGLLLTQYAVRPVTDIATRLLTFKGQAALVVGHSNTILEIARALGTTPTVAEIRHTDYQHLLIVRLRQPPPGPRRATLREETY